MNLTVILVLISAVAVAAVVALLVVIQRNAAERQGLPRNMRTRRTISGGG